MGSLNQPPELSLDFNPTFIPKTITQFLRHLSTINTVSEKLLKLDDFVCRLEAEMRKIDAFKRELPLCMLLINDAIITLKEESTVLQKSPNAEPVLEEFIPLKNTCDEEDPKLEITGGGDKRNWLSATQLWNTPNTNQTLNLKLNSVDEITKNVTKDDEMIDEPSQARAFIPNKKICGFTIVEELPIPGLSLITPGNKNPAKVSFITTGIKNQSHPPPPQQNSSRKQRRCWSTELHRRFVNALQQLGGSQAATPKQIRELMQVDGLTNDEVKSHLQKYRLHTRRLPSSNTSSANQSGVVLGEVSWMPSHDSYIESAKNGIANSGSPDGPLLIGTTTTTGDNSDGEDEKSENYCWKAHHHDV